MKTEIDDLDLKYNSEPICPYCGHHARDAWEINFGGGMEGSTEIECGKCEASYFVEREVTITYTTARIQSKS